MRYEPIPELSRERIEIALAGIESESRNLALFSAALYQPDHEWVETECVRFLEGSSDFAARYTALVCLGHLARLHQVLDLSRIMPILAFVELDPQLNSHVDTLRDEIDIYINGVEFDIDE